MFAASDSYQNIVQRNKQGNREYKKRNKFRTIVSEVLFFVGNPEYRF